MHPAPQLHAPYRARFPFQDYRQSSQRSPSWSQQKRTLAHNALKDVDELMPLLAVEAGIGQRGKMLDKIAVVRGRIRRSPFFWAALPLTLAEAPLASLRPLNKSCPFRDMLKTLLF